MHGELGASGGSQTDPGLQREVLVRRGEFKEAPIKRQLDGLELSLTVCPGESLLLALLGVFKNDFQPDSLSFLSPCKYSTTSRLLLSSDWINKTFNQEYRS